MYRTVSITNTEIRIYACAKKKTALTVDIHVPVYLYAGLLSS